MFSKLYNLRYAALGAALSLFVGQPLLADDTEIFTGRTLNAGQPNILFVIDTSGSMGSTVDFEVPFDPLNPYAGDCNADRIYWTTGESAPDCDTDQWVDGTSFVCQAGWNAVSSSGFYTDAMAQFRDSTNPLDRVWNNLDDNEHTRIVDCSADTGRHGRDSSLTEVYAAERAQGPYSINPDGPFNIDWDAELTYTVYTGNYMNYLNNPSNRILTRLDVVKMVARNTLSQVSGVNVGMMRFERNGIGGMVTRAIAPIDAEFTPITNALDNYRHGGNTPLSETMYEAIQYMMGRSVDYGRNSEGNNYRDEPSVAAARDGNTYISPITKECQKNFVVMLTDGEPTSDTSADRSDRLHGLPGWLDATGQNDCTGNCLEEVGSYLYNHDLSPLNGVQNAVFYTIGFHTDQQLLQDAADNGGGLYFKANSIEQLTQAFTDILDNIIEQDTTFAAPAVAVNTFNRLTHRDELYISMFRPSSNPHWPGNLKRYRLDNTGGDKVIYDATDSPAIDPDTGTFDIDAKSYWTIGDPDGFDSTAGGFASRLHADRNVYTVTSGATSNVTLATASNRVHEDNTALTNSILGVSPVERSGLIRWARGVDDDDQPLNILGDPLHSRPLVMSWGGSHADPDLTLFYATNDGYFHAVDPTASVTEDMEIFSFIPQELLPRLANLRANNRNNPPKFYGLDGTMSYLIQNDNGNRVVDSGERAFVYVGMRRGGRNYYAIEVTDRNNPKLAWTIKGGTGQFAELGQTWSEMTNAKVKIGGTVRDVLIFGGGYDTGQDAAGSNIADNSGRAIYMVDALTGNRLWWAANSADNPGADLPLSEMTNSIPSDLRVIDMNGDGVHDRIYTGDMGGQMWRFDINNNLTSGVTDLVSGGVIADIGGSGSANNRRIFYPPSVALVADEWLGSFLAVSFGTGHRANPLGTAGKTVTDRFYMLRDPYVFSPYLDANGDPVYSSVADSDFLDVTTNLDPSVDQLNAYKGWSITLDNEEKVLAKSLTADGRIFFTSYIPDSPSSLSCNPTDALGSARAYSVAIGTGGPRVIGNPYDPDTPPNPECMGRCTRTQGPIPPEPVLVFTEPPEPEPCDPDVDICPEEGTGGCDGIADAALIIGTDVLDPAICTAPIRTYWFADGDT